MKTYKLTTRVVAIYANGSDAPGRGPELAALLIVT